MSLNLWRCRGTESLLKQELKPGGHSSACSVNRSGWFLAETCWGTLAPPLPVPPQFKHHLHLVSAGKHGKSFTDTNNCRPVTTPVKPSYFTYCNQSGPPHFIAQLYILLPSLYTFVKKVHHCSHGFKSRPVDL
ncbi:hypothetical protein CRENBAI_015200 [Crenichthys baileyi]|uniref:Uncharacterized protein n=1 Tax=Crenichthys baileyi TaxID=28760 RepID=A0AAV9RR67_9TELE